MRTISCPRCGAEVPNLKFCSKCGVALSQAELGPHNSAERASESSFNYHVTGRRIVAALIDLVWLILLFFIIAVVAGDVTTRDESGDSYFEFTAFSTFTLAGWPLLIYYFLAFSYFIVMERVWAATLGKMIMGLTVVKVGGAQYGWIPVLLRNILRIIDGLPTFYLVGFIFVVATQKKQRLGDFAASTLVVRTASPRITPVERITDVSGDADPQIAIEAPRKGSKVLRGAFAISLVVLVTVVGIYFASSSSGDSSPEIAITHGDQIAGSYRAEGTEPLDNQNSYLGEAVVLSQDDGTVSVSWAIPGGVTVLWDEKSTPVRWKSHWSGIGTITEEGELFVTWGGGAFAGTGTWVLRSDGNLYGIWQQAGISDTGTEVWLRN